MDKLLSKFGKSETNKSTAKWKKKGNLLSDPASSSRVEPSTSSAGSSSGRGAAPPLLSPTPSSASGDSTPKSASGGGTSLLSAPALPPRRPVYYEPTAYSMVGGDGAIGGLEWSEPQPSASPSPTPTDGTAESAATTQDQAQRQRRRSVHEQARAEAEQAARIAVPLMGQIDQLTPAQESAVAAMQRQHAAEHEAAAAAAARSNAAAAALVQPTPSPLVTAVVPESEFDNLVAHNRGRSGFALGPAPDLSPAASAPAAIAAPAAAAVSTLPATETTSDTSPSTTRDPALSTVVEGADGDGSSSSKPGSRRASAGLNLPSFALGSVVSAAAMVPGSRGAGSGAGAALSGLSTSTPNSRRSSLNRVEVPAPGLPVVEGMVRSRSSSGTSSSGPTTPVFGSLVHAHTFSAAGVVTPVMPSVHAALLLASASASPHPLGSPTSPALSYSTSVSPAPLSIPAHPAHASGGIAKGHSGSASAHAAQRTPNQSAGSGTSNAAGVAGAAGTAATMPVSNNPRPIPRPAHMHRPPVVRGPASAHMLHIGRAAADEVKSFVAQSSGHLTTDTSSSRITSPGYLAYMSAINQAEASRNQGKEAAAPAAAKKSASSSSSSSSSRPTTSRVMSSPPAATYDQAAATAFAASSAQSQAAASEAKSVVPPLPPRTHIRHRYSVTRYGSRRGSAITGSGLSAAEVALQANRGPKSEEELIPLDPMAHLFMSAYFLLFLMLQLYLPAFIALPAPILAFMALQRLAPAIDAKLGRLRAESDASDAAASVARGDTSPLQTVADDVSIDEVDRYHAHSNTIRSRTGGRDVDVVGEDASPPFRKRTSPVAAPPTTGGLAAALAASKSAAAASAAAAASSAAPQ